MTLETVLGAIAPVRGMSSVIAVLFAGGDARSVDDVRAHLDVTRDRAAAELAKHRASLRECRSDAAYWGYLGAVEYWQMVVNLLDAAALVGADHLPDVSLPPRDGIVMDLLSKQSTFGREVLRLARERAAANAPPRDPKE